jgi:hypothetical protein
MPRSGAMAFTMDGHHYLFGTAPCLYPWSFSCADSLLTVHPGGSNPKRGSISDMWRFSYSSTWQATDTDTHFYPQVNLHPHYSDTPDYKDKVTFFKSISDGGPAIPAVAWQRLTLCERNSSVFSVVRICLNRTTQESNACDCDSRRWTRISFVTVPRRAPSVQQFKKWRGCCP